MAQSENTFKGLGGEYILGSVAKFLGKKHRTLLKFGNAKDQVIFLAV